MKRIPYYVDPPTLTASLIEEITDLIFGEPTSVEPCDIIFIFGGSHPGLWEKGAEAYHAGLGKDIIATGGYKPGALRHATWHDGQTPEADIIRRELLRLRVPEKHIFIETRSTNTYENVRNALEVYDFQKVTSILAVCKSYGVGRQIRTLKAQIVPDVRVIPYVFNTQLGGDGPVITRENWRIFPEARAYLFANVLKMHQYGQAGHLIPIEGLSDELCAMVKAYFEK